MDRGEAALNRSDSRKNGVNLAPICKFKLTMGGSFGLDMVWWLNEAVMSF